MVCCVLSTIPLTGRARDSGHVRGVRRLFEAFDPVRSLRRTLDDHRLTFRMSHYDVVLAPKSTEDRWTHPPFSGHNDGTYIWGRGAADDKALLVAQCASPARYVWLSF